MKNKLILISAVAAACISSTATAADQKKGAEDLAAPSQPYTQRTNRVERLGHPEKANGLIGMQIQNNQDEKLGKVDDLAIDLESGRIVQAVISTGGFLGIGDKTIAVPPSALQWDSASKV